MDSREISRIAKVLGLSGGSNCPPGKQWFDDPRVAAKLRCIANVVIYIEAEFGIESPEEREKIAAFLQELHGAFGQRVRMGDALDTISFSPSALQQRASAIGSRIPATVFVEGMRTQLKNA